MPDNLEEIRELRVRVFEEKPTIEWAIFIRNNRDRKFTDYENSECNLDCKYDVVVGPVADDTVGLLIRQFSRGAIDVEYMKREVIQYLIEDTGMSMEQAMEYFFMSETFAKLNDIETGLYLEGSVYI